MKEQTREDSKILAAAERQMQAWVHSQQTSDRTIQRHDHHEPVECGVEFITISRETGAGAGEIANRLGRRLGWEVLDRTILDRIAERFQVSRIMLDLVDETEPSWVYNVLGSWMDQNIVTHDKFVAHLGRVIRAASRHGKAVIVGRGAQFLLAEQPKLAVRIVAPLEYRLERVMRRDNLDESAARQYIQKKDAGRREFVERFFHRDVEDPHLYDLMINVERLSPDGAVEQILAAACRKRAADATGQ